MKILIIGAGLIGKERIKAIEYLNIYKNNMIDIVGIVDPIFEQPDFKIDLPYPLYISIDQAIKKNILFIDWVFVCTPHFETAKVLKKIFLLGSRVLVEKPLGRDIIEFNKIIEYQNSKQSIKIGFNYRFFKGVNHLLNDFLAGHFGKIVSVNMILGHGNSPGMDKSWKLNKTLCGGGALLDPGIHLIDLAMIISSGSLSLKSHLTWSGFWNTGIDEETHILATDKYNAIYNIAISLTKWKSTFKLEINGTEGYGIVEGRGRSYGDQTYTRGTRWGWMNAKSQKDSEEILISNYNGDDSFILETEKILFEKDCLQNSADNVCPANDADNKACLDFINLIYKNNI